MSNFDKECKISIKYNSLDSTTCVPWACHRSNNEHMIMTYFDVSDERKYKVDYIHMKNIITLKELFPTGMIRLNQFNMIWRWSRWTNCPWQSSWQLVENSFGRRKWPDFLLSEMINHDKKEGRQLCVTFLDLAKAFGAPEQFVDVVDDLFYIGTPTVFQTDARKTGEILITRGVKQGVLPSTLLYGSLVRGHWVLLKRGDLI